MSAGGCFPRPETGTYAADRRIRLSQPSQIRPMKSVSLRCLAIVVLPLMLFVTGCGLLRSTPKTPPVVGVWTYVVKNTPQGNAPGVLTVRYEDGRYTGQLKVDMLFQTVPIEDASFEEGTFSCAAMLDIDGQKSRTTAEVTVEGDTMTGRIEVPGFGSFPLTATRKTSAPGGS